MCLNSTSRRFYLKNVPDVHYCTFKKYVLKVCLDVRSGFEKVKKKKHFKKDHYEQELVGIYL